MTGGAQLGLLIAVACMIGIAVTLVSILLEKGLSLSRGLLLCLALAVLTAAILEAVGVLG